MHWVSVSVRPNACNVGNIVDQSLVFDQVKVLIFHLYPCCITDLIHLYITIELFISTH